MKFLPCFFLLICLPTLLPAQTAPELRDLATVRAQALLPDFLSFLALPSDAHHPEQLEPNLLWLEAQFAQRGFTTQRLATEGIPLLLAEYKVPDATHTMLFYLHVDGQPVDSSKWFQPNPYQPVVKERDDEGQWAIRQNETLTGAIDPEWRIFARAAADDKGPIVMFLAAWDALQELGQLPNYHVKLMLDPEEEIGSPHLKSAVEKHREALATDGLIIMDGPAHSSNQPTLTFGARGIARLTLTTYGPILPQHSGHFGNYAPNPALRLAQLLASMKDEEGRVTIPGFYDGIALSPALKAALAAVPEDEAALQRRLGLGSIDQVGANLQEALQYPSLNIRGLASAWVGDEVRTIIPATATAEIDIRLVKESDPQRLMELIYGHIREQGYEIVDHTPDLEERLAHPRLVQADYGISYQAFRTEMDAPIGQWLQGGVRRAHGQDPIRLRTMGGSVPISPMIQALGVPAVVLPVVNSDNNQHSPNENLRLGNYFDGTLTLLGVLLEPYAE